MDRVGYTALKGWTFAFIIFTSAFFGALFLIPPFLPLIILRPRLWRWIMDRLVGIWLILPTGLVEFLFGAKVTVQGDPIEYDVPGLIIMNHRTSLDWLFFWNALYKMDPWLCTSEKISMKGILKYIPGAGWAMGANSFLFLDRRFDTDKTKLELMIQYYKRVDYNYQLLLFPEGTDMCLISTERSRVFAEKKKLQQYECVLHPRTTGFVHIVEAMRKVGYIKYIYDVTVAYPDNIVQTEIDLAVNGECPEKIDYYVRKIPIDSLPKDEQGLIKWLNNAWKEKEDLLKKYYSKPSAERHFVSDNEFHMTFATRCIQLFAVAFWIFFSFFWLIALLKIKFLAYFASATIVFFVIIDMCYGGIEWFAVKNF